MIVSWPTWATLSARTGWPGQAARRLPLGWSHLHFGVGLGLTAALAAIAMVVAPLPGLRVLGPLSVALLLGIAWRATLSVARHHRAGVRFSARTLLRWGVILMGVRLNFALVAHAGPRIVALDALIVVAGLLGITLLGKRAGLSPGLRTAVAFGSSICGASAVGAIVPLAGATEEEASIAVGICGVLGTIGVVLYTVGAPLLRLTRTQYGVLTGSTLHEVAQVIAAAFAQGAQSGDLGTVVKLTRVLLLAPAALALTMIITVRDGQARQGAGGLGAGLRQVPVPYFVFGFIGVATLTTVGLIPAAVASLMLQASAFLFLMAMAAMGLQVDLGSVRRTGLPALAVAAVGWVGLAVLSRVLITLFGIT